MSWQRFAWPLVVAMIVSAPPIAFAQPAVEGFVQPIQARVADVTLSASGIAWQGEVKVDSSASFFRLHFTEIAVNGDADFAVVVRNVAGRVLASISRRDFTARGDYWSPYLFGHYALVELVPAEAAPNTKIAFRISEVGIETQGARLLNRQNDNDPKDLPLWRFQTNAPLMAAARAVAKLRYTRNQILYSCTGFLLTDDLLLTNQHCVRSNADCATAVAQFGYKEDKARNIDLGEEYACERLEDSDAGLDFALLRLKGTPGSKWGKLKWRSIPIPSNAAIFLVQHPSGRPMRVAREGCLIKTASAIGSLPGQETDVGHTCDTESGSSGSPLFDQRFQVVALHHLGFDNVDPRWAKENRAIQAPILSRRLAPFLQPPH